LAENNSYEAFLADIGRKKYGSASAFEGNLSRSVDYAHDKKTT